MIIRKEEWIWATIVQKYRNRCLDRLHRKLFAYCKRSILPVAQTETFQKQQTSFLARLTCIPSDPSPLRVSICKSVAGVAFHVSLLRKETKTRLPKLAFCVHKLLQFCGALRSIGLPVMVPPTVVSLQPLYTEGLPAWFLIQLTFIKHLWSVSHPHESRLVFEIIVVGGIMFNFQ